MRIGILKTGQAPDVLRDELGDYDTMFETLLAGRGFEFTSYHVEAMQFPASVHAAEGWLVTGSRHGVYEDHAFIPPLADFIRRAYAEHVPLVGICFGHQMIAQALGGKVEKYAGGWAIGAQDYDFEGEQITLNAWHQDQVVQRPDGARPIASNGFCENAALVYDDRALTVQGHPEFGDTVIAGLIDHRSSTIPVELVERAKARISGAGPSSQLADRIEAFLKAPRAAARGAA